MDWFDYSTQHGEKGREPAVSVGALASRYRIRLGEFPAMPRGEAFWFREPFDRAFHSGVSDTLQIPAAGTTDGHNLATDSNILDSLNVDPWVPLSPLFVRDLCGRTVYTGYGPELKPAAEWQDYLPVDMASGKLDGARLNPFVPQVVFPRFCRDVREMEGRNLLENVFLTKFRCLECGLSPNVVQSVADEEDEASVALAYSGANLYPYKLRLDTFYIDGWRLPQTQMVFVKTHNTNPRDATQAGADFLKAWQEREPGTGYEDWLHEMGGQDRLERLYQRGCTVIPTFDACNGFNVVDRDFGLDDYWPGRAVPGLHDTVEERADKSPAGTILQVVSPGYVTHDDIVMAQVIVSDGSGYVSSNAADPLPLLPNLNLPHSRTLADWEAVWVPTHPEHFERPALWGWDSTDSGRFVQISGPLWDPLHYYYGSVDEVLRAYENPLPPEENRWLVEVPDHMRDRFYPVLPLPGFDTMSASVYRHRREANLLPRSCLHRVDTARLTAGSGYHPLPPEFEFELEPFWFPLTHPLNRDISPCPEELTERLVPIITPAVTIEEYRQSLQGQGLDDIAEWLGSEDRLFTPNADAFVNYPFLVRYLIADLPVADLLKIAPPVFLGGLRDLLKLPPQGWWLDAKDRPLDLETTLDFFPNGYHEALWDARQDGVDLIKFRHMLYQVNPTLYLIGWWYGSSPFMLENMAAEWMVMDAPELLGGDEALAQLQGQNGQEGPGQVEARQQSAANTLSASRGQAPQMTMPEETL